MERGSIDLKTISYRDVASSSSFSFPKPSLYVTIYLLGAGDGDGDGDEALRRLRGLRHRHKTPLLPYRRDPEWDHPVRIYIDGPDPLPSLLRFELTARSLLRPDRVVGAVSVPVADLCSAGDLRRASYQVTSPDGKPNGVLSFSYVTNAPSPASFAAAKAAAAAAPPPPPTTPPPPTKAKLYPSLSDLIPDPPPPPETARVCYPAIDPAPPMDALVLAYPAPAQFSGWRYPAPQCGYCGYFAPPGCCGCTARR